MIYPNSGISIFAHLAILSVTKVKNFLGFKTKKENGQKKESGGLNKILVSFAVAVIIESVFFLVIGSSVAIVDAGFVSKESNLKIIENVIHNYETIKH